MIDVTGSISIQEDELDFEFVRSGGPGGQKVNKTSSAVVMKFDIRNSPSLPEEVRKRLEEICGNRVNREGILVIHARRHRSQIKNRESAVNRLIKLIRKASETPVERKPTKPSATSDRERLAGKKRRGLLKKSRNYKPLKEDFE
ncbi:MAG: aminoacyl-tRNA hydrolase [Candidatus Aegiribacteria sp.]|nr:aminoacyl-tRNA hydrolase [Candidatus Aegiribacteria sp.]